MPTTTQEQIDKALASGYSQNQIDALIQKQGATIAPAPMQYLPTSTSIPNQVTSMPINAPKSMPLNADNRELPIGYNSGTIQPNQVQAPTGATYGEKNILPPSVTGYGNTPPKPTIATTDKPVIGTTPATNTPIGDFSKFTPEQNYSKAMEIYTKDPSEVTKEETAFLRSLKFRIDNGEDVYGKKGKSSGSTTYSTELIQPGENIASSVRNSDGSYQVTYKDGATQVITESPTKTIFPEGTPEFFAQKQADEAEKRIADLTIQMNNDSERRKKETADLVAKYGENIAGQFQSQKAEIEAQGAKRMETLNSGLSFSGFGRSTLALDKRDEIAKNIETTINQAKAKADLELMAYRMDREGADAEAISAMRKNIAQVQSQIDDANYANQLEIIKLNQENATTGSEAMNNFLETISNSAEIVSNADLDKSQELGYFVDKNGALMLDSQKRPIQFEGNRGTLDPTAIGAYADAIKNKIIDEKILDTLSPADKDAVMKLVGVRDGSWTGGFTDISQATGDVRSAPGAQQYAGREAWATTNNPSGITVNNNFSAKLEAAGIQFSTKPRPSNEGGEYYVFSDISDGLKAHQIALKNSGWQDVYTRLYKWSAGGVNTTPQDIKEANKKAYAENLMRQAGIPMGTKFSELTPEQENKLLSAHIAKESPNLAKILGTGGQGGGAGYSETDIELLSELANMDASPRNTALKAQGILLQRVTDYMAQAKAGNIPPTESQKQSSAQIMSQIQDLVSTDWNDATGFQINPFFSIGGTDRATAEGKIASLIAAITLPNLGMLKGPMSDKDLAFIQNASTRLNTKQSDKEFEKQLIELYNIGARKNGMKEITKLSDMPKDRIMAGQNKITPTGNTGTTAPTPPIGGGQVVNGAI